jgi:thiamine monophosphate kinase
MNLAETIKLTIEPKVCDRHGIHPIVEIRGEDYELICCCSNFENECMDDIEKVSANHPG